jgi:DnaJ-class molecular chaperone
MAKYVKCWKCNGNGTLMSVDPEDGVHTFETCPICNGESDLPVSCGEIENVSNLSLD